MVAERDFDVISSKLEGVLANTNNNGGSSKVIRYQYHVKDILARPGLVIYILMGVWLVIGTAIRLTRTSASSSVASFHTFIESTQNESMWKRGLNPRTWLIGFWKLLKRLPCRIWNFYIEAFLVPGYRKEWGKYKAWSYRSTRRPHKSPALIEQLRLKKAVKKIEGKRPNRRPCPVPHCHSDCKRIRINVSGVHFETQLRTLERFPDTLLGNPDKRIKFYNPKKEEYYFERTRNVFEVILYFYQSGGKFRKPENVQADVLLEDAKFFQISQAVIDQYQIEEGLAPPAAKQEIIPKGLFYRKLWLLFDFPESSNQAKLISFISIFTLFLSIGVFCVETLETFQHKSKYGIKEDGTVKVVEFSQTDLRDPFFITETACNVWFLLEYLARLSCCPLFSKFLQSGVNFIDIVSVLPYGITVGYPTISKLITGSTNTGNVDESVIGEEGMSTLNSLSLLRIVRVIRVFRIFKLSRHSKGLKVLGRTLKASLNELILLFFFIVLAVVLFSSMVYFAESDIDQTTEFHSIPGGFWWAVITITTVGFGDIVPKSGLGKVVGSLCAVAGVLTIALPVPVIVSNFNYFYHQAVDDQDLKIINVNHVPSCPFRPTGYYHGIQKNYVKPKQAREERQPIYSSEEEFGNLLEQNKTE